jgi:hypothetical protein
MRGLLQGVQPKLQPYHTHEETQRLQALRLRIVRKKVPTKSRSAPSSRLAARSTAAAARRYQQRKK